MYIYTIGYKISRKDAEWKTGIEVEGDADTTLISSNGEIIEVAEEVKRLNLDLMLNVSPILKTLKEQLNS